MSIRVARSISSAVLAVVFLAALLDALQFKGLGGWFPLLASSVGLAMAIVLTLLVATGHDLGPSAFDIGHDDLEPGLEASDMPQWWILTALAIFPPLVAAIGTLPAVLLWLPAFLYLIARQKWWVAILGTAAGLAVISMLQLYIGMVLPGSIFVD